MNVLLWFLILILFVLSFVALFYPVLPSVTAVWAGFLIYHFLLNSTELTTFFWVSMIALTLILTLADILASSLSVKRFGGSKLGERVAAIDSNYRLLYLPTFWDYYFTVFCSIIC